MHGMRHRTTACVLTLFALIGSRSPAAETPRDIQDDRDRYNQRQRDDAARGRSGVPEAPMPQPSASGAADERERDRDRHQAELNARYQADIDRVQADIDQRKADEQKATQAAARAWASTVDEAHPFGRSEESTEQRWARLELEVTEALAELEHAQPGDEVATKALATIEKDMKAGLTYATLKMANLLIEGRFVNDPARGRELLQSRLDAWHMNELAILPYARCLELGVGGPTDEPLARAWYFTAIAKHAPDAPLAMRRLAAMDESGRGAKADPVAAYGWYRQAAEKGDAPSRLRQAQMLRDGVGTQADPVAAKALFETLMNDPDPEISRKAGDGFYSVDRP